MYSLIYLVFDFFVSGTGFTIQNNVHKIYLGTDPFVSSDQNYNGVLRCLMKHFLDCLAPVL